MGNGEWGMGNGEWGMGNCVSDGELKMEAIEVLASPSFSLGGVGRALLLTRPSQVFVNRQSGQGGFPNSPFPIPNSPFPTNFLIYTIEISTNLRAH